MCLFFDEQKSEALADLKRAVELILAIESRQKVIKILKSYGKIGTLRI